MDVQAENNTLATSPEFRRIISLSLLFSPSLLPATLSAVAGALLLVPAVFFVAGGIWLVGQGSAESVPPEAIKGLIEQISVTLPIPGLSAFAGKLTESAPVRTAFAAMLSLAVGCWFVRLLLVALSQRLCQEQIGNAVVRLRQHVHRKAIRLEPADLTGEQAQAAERIFQNTTDELERQAVRWSQAVCPGVLELSVLVLVSLAVNWRVALQTMIPILLGCILLHRETVHHRNSRSLLAEQIHRGLNRIAESLRKARIVSSFGMETREQEQFLNQLQSHKAKCLQLDRQDRLRSAYVKSLTLLTIGIPAVILGLHLLNGLPALTGIFLTGLLCLFFQQIRELPEISEAANSGSEQAEVIAEFLRRIPSISQASGAGFLQPMARTLTFNQVCFQTDRASSLLNQLDLRIVAGEKIALLSLQPSAAYAAALMIPRFIDPEPGQILIDGRDIREATLESLRAEAVFVGGNDPVFDATVLENITCGQSDITKQQAIDAAKSVHADHFIRTLPMGYETHLGEHGLSLDHGQTFRLSLARAAVRRPALMIIEESSAALDSETKTMLDDAYQRIGSDKTIIFLPTRLSTVKRCSRIVMIHEGRVAVDGTHEQLVRSSELYQHWEYMRFNPHRDAEET